MGICYRATFEVPITNCYVPVLRTELFSLENGSDLEKRLGTEIPIASTSFYDPAFRRFSNIQIWLKQDNNNKYNIIVYY